MLHSIYVDNNPKLFKSILYFHLSLVHAHIILWINEIVAMVLATIDE